MNPNDFTLKELELIASCLYDRADSWKKSAPGLTGMLQRHRELESRNLAQRIEEFLDRKRLGKD